MEKNEFEHIVSTIRGKLLNIARQFIKASGSAVDAEDIVQESLIELWLLMESGSQYATLRYWQ